jgi:UDP-2,3-diacylglucosamine pyrophosphatase LpxH
LVRRIFVLSDFHLGGKYPDPPAPGKRGFRLCTQAAVIARFVEERTKEIAKSGPSEIVLNGDTVDFLAELDVPAAGAGSFVTWSPFTADPAAAVAKFQAIVARDKGVFDSFAPFLDAGGRLTVLLGNHDLELSLPSVRKELRKALGVKPGHDFEFFYDGEAYIVGDAVIEHGNRYDAWNQVDLDGLRRVRSLTSRRQAIPEKYRFGPPAGSKMVADVINQIKCTYAFVDLLKPENSAAVPVLLALEPDSKKSLGTVARLWYWTRSHGLEGPTLPRFGGDIRAEVEASDRPIGFDIGANDTNAAADILGALDEREALKGAISDALGAEGEDFLRDLDGDDTGISGSEISASETFARVRGLYTLLTSRDSTAIEKRMRALLRALRGLQNTETFDPSKETATEYLDAASGLMTDSGFRYVVFGHTHQAKCVDLGEGKRYLNTGTWADVLRFPTDILTLPEQKALAKLRAFVDELATGDVSRWTLFRPTYARLELDDTTDKVTKAELCEFN